MAEQYTNIRTILDRIMRHPLLQDLTLETIVTYTIDFMRIVGTPALFLDKIEDIEIVSYRGKLPCDWYETIQVLNSETFLILRETTDTFYKTIDHNNEIAEHTFKVQGNLIYTNIETGSLKMSYRAIATDTEGYPLIPENSNFYRALEAYIKKTYFTILFDMGKVTQSSLQLSQQDYAFAVGACETDMLKLDLSKAESFFNSFRTLIVRDSEFNRGFVNNGTKEMMKIQ